MNIIFWHFLLHIFIMKASKSVDWGDLPSDFRSKVGSTTQGAEQMISDGAGWWMGRLRWKAAFRPVKVDTPALVKPKTKTKESNPTISDTNIGSNTWGPGKTLEHAAADFNLSLFHSWRGSVFLCFSVSRCVIRDVLLLHLSSRESRLNHEDLSTNPWESDLMPSQRRWYVHDMHDTRCMEATCCQYSSFKSWDAGDPRWIRRCGGGRTWRCVRGKTFSTLMLISLWSHVDVVWTRHHLNCRKTSKSPVKRYGIRPIMTRTARHTLAHHDMTHVSGIQQLETLETDSSLQPADLEELEAENQDEAIIWHAVSGPKHWARSDWFQDTSSESD